MTDTSYTALTKPPAQGAPLVLALHGTGGDEHQFFALAQDLVPEGGVISPRGDVSERGAARFFRRSGEGVYDMADLRRATAKMIAYVEDWRSRFPKSPVFAFGYSNGANILASVMMARPDLFDRIGLLHPLIPWKPGPSEGLDGRRILITAGRNDPICPWPLSEELIRWAEAQGAHVATSIHEGGHELRREEVLALAALFSGHAREAAA
ncbi:alpha/beta hydrolase [Dinoroseobacter sp. S375]|uniref:alpha/beta hydrolase n=1 Tax=Dinoroseobacter sp. S375 TaxID=3415136 RepID=UPI003C7E1B25